MSNIPNIEIIKGYIKAGRCWNGAYTDCGLIVHAVKRQLESVAGPNFGKALCGAVPGRRGYGWDEVSFFVNCPKCLKKLNIEV